MAGTGMRRKRSNSANPVYGGRETRGVNRGAASILGRKSRRSKPEAEPKGPAGALSIKRRNARVRNNVEEQRKRALRRTPPAVTPERSRQGLPVTAPKSLPARICCVYCRAVHDDISDHIETVHGPEKLIRWLLSR